MARGEDTKHHPARQPRRPWSTMGAEDRARLENYISGGSITPHHDMLIDSYDIPQDWLSEISSVPVAGSTAEDRSGRFASRLQRIDSIKRRQNRS